MNNLPKYMKWCFWGILFLFVACSKNSGDIVPKNASLSFIESTVPLEELSTDGGTISIEVESSYTTWNIKAGDAKEGQKFITQITPANAGSAYEENTQTSVSIIYGSNLTSTQNRQQVIISSVTDNLSDTIVIIQAAKPVVKQNVTIDPSITYQTVSGFGGANAIWGTDYLSSSEMDLAFGTGDNDLGLSILRVRLSSDKNDWAGLVNSIKGANAHHVKVLATPWSPPAVWKSNNSVDGGGSLLETHYADFVNYINEFIQYMSSQGATVDVVSIQNEPDWKAPYEGCEYTTSEMFNFVKNYAGGIKGAKVLAAESLNFNQAYTDDILNDPVAADNLDIIGGHLYGAGLEPYPLAVQKGKEIWMTEHLLNLDSGNNPENWTGNTDVKTIWDESMKMVREIQTAMMDNWNAYIWWYIRRYYSFLGDGERGTTRGQILKRGYAMSQFAKFVRPGYVRIQARLENTSSGLIITAYKGDNKIVVAIVNPTNVDVPGVNLINSTVVSSAVAYTTSEFVNRKMENLTPDNTNVTVDITANSVTTIVIE